MEYIRASPQMILSGALVGRRVAFSDTVGEKPKLVTRRKNPLLGPPEVEFYTIIKTSSGITVGYPGIALVGVGEEIRVFGTQGDKTQVVADVVEGEKMVFEIQD